MRAPVTLEYDLMMPDAATATERSPTSCAVSPVRKTPVVNNNAAAVLLMLAASRAGRQSEGGGRAR